MLNQYSWKSLNKLQDAHQKLFKYGFSLKHQAFFRI